MSERSLPMLDEATRPGAPSIAGVTAAQRRNGQRLALFHAMHIQQLDAVRKVMERIEAGEESLAMFPEAISSLQMADNYRLFGTLCGRECVLLNYHHTSEDASIFPVLRQGSEGLNRVIDRLVEEHSVVHRLLMELEARAATAVEQPGSRTYSELKETFLLLDRTVRSHFGYEEKELEEALGYFAVPL